jgi:VanZ family protein
VLLPLLASLLVVFGAPYVGDIRGALQTSFPEYYRLIVAVAVAAGVISAIVSAAVHLRRHGGDSRTAAAVSDYPPWLRYTLLAVAVTIAVVYARTVSGGNLDVDLVEAFHFVEYGFIAFLFYRVTRRCPDVRAVVLPACASLLVGIADEWMQWLVPGRVGELHDVWLNAVAICCGLLFSVAMHPPASLALPGRRSSRRTLGAAFGLLILVVAGFVDRVHLGYEIADGETGVFRSRYDAKALAAAVAERPSRWRLSPPAERGFAHEDHYLSEGLWHVQRRNMAITAGDHWTAWNENLILEKYYSPVLDRGSRLPPDQRIGIEQHPSHASARGFVSNAQPYPIYVPRREMYWGTMALMVAMVAGLCVGPRSAEPTGRAA